VINTDERHSKVFGAMWWKEFVEAFDDEVNDWMSHWEWDRENCENENGENSI